MPGVVDEVAKARADLEAALATRDPQLIEHTLVSHAWVLYSWHYDLLMQAIAGLPSSVIERQPLMRLVHPMTPILARTSRPFPPFVAADEARQLSTEELDLLALSQLIVARLSGDEEAALKCAKRLESRILQGRDDFRDRRNGPLWYLWLQLGSTRLVAGDTSRALQDLSTAAKLAALTTVPDAERLVRGRTALTLAVRGSFAEAERALAEALQQAPPTQAHVRASLATERATAALLAVETLADDLDERLAELEPYDSIEMTWPFALLARSRAFLARHEPDAALDAIHLSRETHHEHSWSFANDVFTSVNIEAHIGIGDLARAKELSAATRAPGFLTRIAMIRAALCIGDLDTAQRWLLGLERDTFLNPGARAETTLLAAWHDLSRKGALEMPQAQRVARFAQQPQHRRMFALLPEQLCEAVRSALPETSGDPFCALKGSMAAFEVHARPQLTGGEKRVLKALTTHRTTASIARDFHVSPNTIKSQLQSLYRKLGCSSREEAVEIAARMQLFGTSVSAQGASSSVMSER